MIFKKVFTAALFVSLSAISVSSNAAQKSQYPLWVKQCCSKPSNWPNHKMPPAADLKVLMPPTKTPE